MTVRALVADAAATAGTRATVLAPDRPDCSGEQLLAGIDEIGARLRAAGVGRNDRVAIVVPNGPEMAVSFLAVAAYATAAPLNPAYKAADFEFYLSDLSARVVIVQAGFDSPVRDVAAEMGVPVMELQVDPAGAAGIFHLAGEGAGDASNDGPAEADDIALVLHTSGTTSRPEDRAAESSQRVHVGGQHRLDVGAHPRGPMPQRDAVVPHPWADGGGALHGQGGCVDRL